MAWGYDSLITELESKYGLAENRTSSARNSNSKAYTHYIASEDHSAIYDLYKAIDYNNQAIELLLAQGFYGWPGDTHALLNALNRSKACPFITEAPPTEVSMDAILSAMISSDFDDLQKFIGLIDAYRVALWNKPFNADFYAALARGFAT